MFWEVFFLHLVLLTVGDFVLLFSAISGRFFSICAKTALRIILVIARLNSVRDYLSDFSR